MKNKSLNIERPPFFYFVLERIYKVSAILLGLVIALVIALKFLKNFQGLQEFFFNHF